MTFSVTTARLWLPFVTFAILLSVHFTSLSAPYFWDEAGYFVPAANDFFLTWDPIPYSVAPNPHPPFVSIVLSVSWWLFGTSPVVTRLTMLAWASFGLTGCFALGWGLGGVRTAITSCVCAFCYPVFLAQAPLAQLDMPAAVLTIWGLVFLREGRAWPMGAAFTLAVLSKETAVIAPICALLVNVAARKQKPVLLSFLFPLGVLALWFLFVANRTGTPFGNSEFERYNASVSALSIQRVLAGLVLRLWHAFGHFFLFVLTLPAVVSAISKGSIGLGSARDVFRTQLSAVILGYVVAFSVFGGAALARYMLPAVLVTIVLAVDALVQFSQYWWAYTGLAAVLFISTWRIPPPYHYAYDENLLYRDFVTVHRNAGEFLSRSSLAGPLITTWPATDEFAKPDLGYISKPVTITPVQSLSLALVREKLANCPNCPVFLFATQYEPSESFLRPRNVLRYLAFWKEGQRQFETRPTLLPPTEFADKLGGRVVWQEQRGIHWAAIIQPPGELRQ